MSIKNKRTQPIQIVTKRERDQSSTAINQPDQPHSSMLNSPIHDRHYDRPHDHTYRSPPSRYSSNDSYRRRSRSPRIGDSGSLTHSLRDRSPTSSGSCHPHSPSHQRRGHSRSRSRSRSHGRTEYSGRPLLRPPPHSRSPVVLPPIKGSSASFNSSTTSTGEWATDFKLMTYDTMRGRLWLNHGQTERFEVTQPRLNLDHQELLHRVIWFRPPEPVHGMDMTKSENDECYLRNAAIPILRRSSRVYESIQWIAVERNYLLPNSSFNIVIQLAPMPGLQPNLGMLICHLNASESRSSTSTFNQYQCELLQIKYTEARRFCIFYFEITPSRGGVQGCQTYRRKGKDCPKSHQLEQIQPYIQQLLIEAGAPLQSSIPKLQQPDIPLETFEPFKGALKLLPGCTSIDQTIYDPNITIATRDSESIIHRLVWTDTINPPSMDELTTYNARANDLCQVLGQLMVDRMIRFDEIDWITRIYTYGNQPTKFILIQCTLITPVTAPIVSCNRLFKVDPPLKLFLHWWLQQRLSTMVPHPDISQRMCQRRWEFVRLDDGRLINNCDRMTKKSQQPCRFSHDRQLMIDFIQRERAVATTALQIKSQAGFSIQPSLHQPRELSQLSRHQLASSEISPARRIRFSSSSNAISEPQISTTNFSPNSISPALMASTNDLNSPSDSSAPNYPLPPPPVAQHPYLSSYPPGSVLIDADLLPTGQIVRQPPLTPFTSHVNSQFNLYIPTDGPIFQFRDEWTRTGQLSDANRLEDVQICLTKLKEMGLLTPDMDLLMVQRHIDLSGDTPSFQLLCHFRSHASLIKLQARFQAMHEGRPLEQ